MVCDDLAIDFDVRHTWVDWCLGRLLLDESGTIGLANRLPALLDTGQRRTRRCGARAQERFLGVLRRGSASALPEADGEIHVDPWIGCQRFGASHSSVESALSFAVLADDFSLEAIRARRNYAFATQAFEAFARSNVVRSRATALRCHEVSIAKGMTIEVDDVQHARHIQQRFRDFLLPLDGEGSANLIIRVHCDFAEHGSWQSRGQDQQKESRRHGTRP